MTSNYKILSELSDAEINKLYKEYIKIDGKHKNFKGTKREYCSTVAEMVNKFLKGPKETLEGSGKFVDDLKARKPDFTKYFTSAAADIERLREQLLKAQTASMRAHIKKNIEDIEAFMTVKQKRLADLEDKARLEAEQEAQLLKPTSRKKKKI